MNKEVVPAINDNIAAIKEFPAEIEKIRIEIINQMKQEVNLYVKNNVMPPLINMKNIFETLGEGVKRDIIIIGQQSNNLITTLGNESKAMQTEFIGFGTDIKKESQDIANAAVEVAQQMSDAINEIQPVIANATIWAKRIDSRRKRGDWLGAFHAAYITLERMMWEGVDGNKAIFLEMLEAYQQIGKAFNNLNNQFKDFGGILNYRTNRVSNQFEASGINISGEMNALTSSLKGLFTNMADRIKGGTGEVLQAIEYQDIETRKVEQYKTSEQKEAEARMTIREEIIQEEQLTQEATSTKILLPDGRIVRVI
jgi:hypothetical protein